VLVDAYIPEDVVRQSEYFPITPIITQKPTAIGTAFAFYATT